MRDGATWSEGSRWQGELSEERARYSSTFSRQQMGTERGMPLSTMNEASPVRSHALDLCSAGDPFLAS